MTHGDSVSPGEFKHPAPLSGWSLSLSIRDWGLPTDKQKVFDFEGLSLRGIRCDESIAQYCLEVLNVGAIALEPEARLTHPPK